MNIARKSFVILQGNLVTKLLGLVGMVLIARRMGPGPIGMLAFAYSFIGLFEFLFDPGFSTAHIKLAAEKKDFGRCVGTYIVLKIASASLGSLVVLGATLWTVFFRGGFESSELGVIVVIILLSKVIESIFTYPFTTFNATQEMAKRTSIKIVKSVSDLVFVAAVALFYRNVIALALTHVLTEIVVAVISVYLFRNYPIQRPRRSDLVRYLKFSLPLIGTMAIGLISSNVDKVMIQFFWGSVQVGQYHCAGRAIALMLILSSSLMTVLIPYFSARQAEGKHGELNETLAKAEKYMLLLIGPVIMVIFVFARPLVNLVLGREFEASVPIMRILCVSTLSITLIRPINALIIGVGRVRWIFIITCLGVGINFILNLLLIPERFFGLTMAGLGAPGAAIATATTQVICTVVTIIYIRKTMRINPLLKIAKYVLPLLVTLPFFIYLVIPLIGEGFWSLLLIPPALALYIGVLMLVGEFGKTELQLLRAACNPRELKTYISREFSNND